MTDRIEVLRDALANAESARRMKSEPVWNPIWDTLERELLGRLLDLGPDDDEARWRLSQAINVTRRVRNLVESEGATRDQIIRELDRLEGRVLPAVA
jgi:hypothetical protein